MEQISRARGQEAGTPPIICRLPRTTFTRAQPIPATADGQKTWCRPLDRARVGPRALATALRRPTLSKEASRALRFSQVSSLSCCHLTSERDKKTRSDCKDSRSAGRIALVPPHARHTASGCLSRSAPCKHTAATINNVRASLCDDAAYKGRAFCKPGLGPE